MLKELKQALGESSTADDRFLELIERLASDSFQTADNTTAFVLKSGEYVEVENIANVYDRTAVALIGCEYIAL